MQVKKTKPDLSNLSLDTGEGIREDLIYHLHHHNSKICGEVSVSASKSESNRTLLIKALSNQDIFLDNLSKARDTQTMQKLLDEKPVIWDVKDAGTTMRFLTAYLAVKGSNKIITGSDRMKERPIGLLTDALRTLGSVIEYMSVEGYPPLNITKISKQKSDKIAISGNISSQYISALLMIAPILPSGLIIELTSEIYSRPYIEMTCSLMRHFGVDCEWNESTLKIPPSANYSGGRYTIENDWSGASYWYGFVALAASGSVLHLPHLKEKSFQGDRRIAEIMEDLGVITEFKEDSIILSKSEWLPDNLNLDLKDCPDLAQTIMVIAAAKGVRVTFSGLESLKIKETDRILAMRTELHKMGAKLMENGKQWYLIPSAGMPAQMTVDTYQDHRMAMAFAPLSQVMNIIIKNPVIVEKSYPEFWSELKQLGVKITEIS